MDNHNNQIAKAFSRKAKIYDRFGEGHENLERMRHKVRVHVLSLLKQGDKILELNAGTGADAAYFAKLGFRVHATDISPGMLSQIEQKTKKMALERYLTWQHCSFGNLQKIKRGPFNFVFSNMGGVNCTTDIGPIVRGIRALLLPGGYITWVVMPPFCPWEVAQAMRGNTRTALRRFSSGGVIANVEGVQFKTTYYSPRQIRHSFGPDFYLEKLEGLSVFTPTADNKTFSQTHPRLFAILKAVDDRLAGFPPFNNWGDFYIITLRYLPMKAN